ncbi:MAG: response regulator [Caulobacter sp.]|nr:response regulator [Caulobacter sp.]
MTASPPPASPKVVLIVEDQLLVAMALKEELEERGYRVLDLAVRHQEALALARATPVDLALVNIDLAGDDDGSALAWDLKAIGVPVIFISGQENRVEQVREAAIASMPKPYNAFDLVEAVGYVFRQLAGGPPEPVPPKLNVFALRTATPAA